MANMLFSFSLRRIAFHSIGCNVKIVTRSLSVNTSKPKKTCLYDYHVKSGGKMVNFAGFLMPVHYESASITESHLQTRQSAGLFDVSHMMQMVVRGKDAIDFMESITVADIATLDDNTGTLTLYTNETGGIIDDLIVSKTSEGYLYVVSNAGRIDQDLAHVSQQVKLFKSKGKDVTFEVISDRGLLALQGPAAAECLQPLVEVDLSRLYFMSTALTRLCGFENCRITRCGYTGEDGFELSIPDNKAEEVVETLLKNEKVKLAGLGPRDTLRLEAGLCLYGNDIDEVTTPIEAGLAWTITKRRREMANFPGSSVILEQLKNKPSKRRVGLVATAAGPPARNHAVVCGGESREKVGQVTSGSPAPSLKKNIAMAYVDSSHAKTGTKILCDVRGKMIEHEVVKMPFIKTNYYLKKKQ